MPFLLILTTKCVSPLQFLLLIELLYILLLWFLLLLFLLHGVREKLLLGLWSWGRLETVEQVKVIFGLLRFLLCGGRGEVEELVLLLLRGSVVPELQEVHVVVKASVGIPAERVAVDGAWCLALGDLVFGRWGEVGFLVVVLLGFIVLVVGVSMEEEGVRRWEWVIYRGYGESG